ncbi:MAG: hypothetical protein AAF957_01160 [Planctomycetota bacterium]
MHDLATQALERLARTPRPRLLGAYRVGESPHHSDLSLSDCDPRLLDLARGERVLNAGLEGDDWYRNVAVFRVRRGEGEPFFLEAGNSPSRHVAPGEWAHHSEQHILLHQMRALAGGSLTGTDLVVDQVYSERIPCRDCSALLASLRFCRGAAVFYSVRSPCGSRGRADILRTQYGLPAA